MQGYFSSIQFVGKLVNRGTNSTIQQGAIALQSEGTPIEYRKVLLREL